MWNSLISYHWYLIPYSVFRFRFRILVLASGYLLNRAVPSSFSSWSWLRCLLKNLFTFNSNLPESLKQRCTVCTTTLWATVDHIVSKCPVIRIERKKSLGKKFKILKALRERFWWNLRLQKHRRERQIINRFFDGNFEHSQLLPCGHLAMTDTPITYIGYGTDLPLSRTGHHISRIKSSFELFCALIWDLAHFSSKFEFFFFAVRRRFFLASKRSLRILIVCTSCKTSYNVLSHPHIGGWVTLSGWG